MALHACLRDPHGGIGLVKSLRWKLGTHVLAMMKAMLVGTTDLVDEYQRL